ncbi:hypothetical protein JCM19046_4570 [Bacillus sp. JCM 19046]|nr:hypothetical protein JCM19045_3098 [Bacillus sp. JCM 19045]GAF19884.1 hypothetical protein JCM19046_4570 [Bacillus sp. JCM 19046]
MQVDLIDLDNEELLHQVRGKEAELLLAHVTSVNKIRLRVNKDVAFLGAIAEIIYDLDYIRGTPAQRIEVRLANVQIKRLS